MSLRTFLASAPTPSSTRQRRIAVIGLGYVGRPLAAEFARHGDNVIGYDLREDRRQEASTLIDPLAAAAGGGFTSASTPAGLAGCDTFVIAVPTPDIDGVPDLDPLRGACEAVAGVITPGALVVIESTVYPGVTRTVCAPILDEGSGLTAGADYHLAYSPERINPGDARRGVREVPKVISGITPAAADAAEDLYCSIIDAGVHRAPSLETAEFAKLLENTQRDVNIALMNESATLARALGIDFTAVLDAAATKWNFLPFTPGLVGGHCIAVDPYYLLGIADANDVDLPTVRAARQTNAEYPDVIAQHIVGLAPPATAPTVLVYGATYKANVPDTRNAGPLQLADRLTAAGYGVDLYDPLIAGLDALPEAPVDTVVIACVHDSHRALLHDHLTATTRAGSNIVDLTHTLPSDTVPPRRTLTRI